MHDDELWQIYNDNGTPVEGKGASKEEFNANKDLIMDNTASMAINKAVWFIELYKDEG